MVKKSEVIDEPEPKIIDEPALESDLEVVGEVDPKSEVGVSY